jgi:hypothetical protein
MRIAHWSSRDSSPVNLAVALTHGQHTAGKNAPVIICLDLHYVNHHWDCMGAPGVNWTSRGGRSPLGLGHCGAAAGHHGGEEITHTVGSWCDGRD